MDEANRLVSRYIMRDERLCDELLHRPVHLDQMEIRDAISKLETELYMRNQLLRDSDVMSMSRELELRVPFVDRCLLETVATIPARSRIQDGKRLLIDAIPELPQWTPQQPKRGFLLPFQKWRADEWFDGVTADGENEISLRMDSWYQKWTISIFETWLQQIA